jgi:hypothetical protein
MNELVGLSLCFQHDDADDENPNRKIDANPIKELKLASVDMTSRSFRARDHDPVRTLLPIARFTDMRTASRPKSRSKVIFLAASARARIIPPLEPC